MEPAPKIDRVPAKSVLKPQSRSRSRIELYALLLSSFIWSCGQWLLAPTLPYFAMGLGASALEFSMVSSVYAVFQMMSTPMLGMLSDRIGRRPVLLTGLGATSALYLLMSRVDSFLELLLARALLGCVSGTVAAEVAYISDLTSRDARPSWLKLRSQVQTAGCILGPAVGGILAPYWKRESGENAAFRHLCYAMSLLCIVNFVIGSIFFTDPSQVRPVSKAGVILEPEKVGHKSIASVLRHHLLHRITGRLLLTSFLDSFSSAVSDGPEAYFLRNSFNFVAEDQAIFLMTFSASSLLAGNVTVHMKDMLPAKAVCIMFSLGSAAVMAFITVVRSWWTPYLYAVLFGFTGTVVEVSSRTSLLGKLVPENEQDVVYGIENALLNLAFSLGPLVGGSVYDAPGPMLPYCVSFVFFVFSATLYVGLPSSDDDRGEALLACEEPSEDLRLNPEALEHLCNEVPLPGKKFGCRLATENARRVFFVCPELYERYNKDRRSLSSVKLDGSPSGEEFTVNRSRTIGEEHLSTQLDRRQKVSKDASERACASHIDLTA